MIVLLWKRSFHSKYAQVVELEYTPVSDTGPPGAAGSTPALCTIWAGSESANAADCKSAPFGGSGLDTHPAHQARRAGRLFLPARLTLYHISKIKMQITIIIRLLLSYYYVSESISLLKHRPILVCLSKECNSCSIYSHEVT